MTIEVYRPGVQEPIKIDQNGLFDVLDANGESRVLLKALFSSGGFRQYVGVELSEYESMEEDDRREADDEAATFKPGSYLHLAGGIIVKAT